MARNMVLTYLHLLDPEIPVDIMTSHRDITGIMVGLWAIIPKAPHVSVIFTLAIYCNSASNTM